MKRTHHDLQAWQISMELVKEIYRVSRAFPREEQYGLAVQLRRAAVSVPSNIAEGAGRCGDREFLQFLHIVRGSLNEVETQVRIAHDLGYLQAGDEINQRMDRLFALLGGLINSIKNRSLSR